MITMIDRLYRNQDDELYRFVVSDCNDVVAAKQLKVSYLNKSICAPITACRLSDNSFIGRGYKSEQIVINGIVGWYDKYDEAMRRYESDNFLVLTVNGEIWDIVKGKSCYTVKKLGMIPERVQQWQPKPSEVGDHYLNNRKHITVVRENVELCQISWITGRYDRRVNKRLPEATQTGQISLETFC